MPKKTDICASCNQDKQQDWTYCPYCGAQEIIQDVEPQPRRMNPVAEIQLDTWANGDRRR